MDWMNESRFSYQFTDQTGADFLPKWARDEQMYNCEGLTKKMEKITEVMKELHIFFN